MYFSKSISVCYFVGYRLSPTALNIIVKRYSVDHRITFDDFVACCVRLRALTGMYSGSISLIYRNDFAPSFQLAPLAIGTLSGLFQEVSFTSVAGLSLTRDPFIKGDHCLPHCYIVHH